MERNLTLRDRLLAGPIFGTFYKLPRPEVADVLALAGFDFAICDMEHAQMAETEARAAIRACVANELPVVVRLPEPTQGLVNRLLEAGAAGIQMPRLKTSAEVQQLYAFTHFPPRGCRSAGNANRLAAYGGRPLAQYIDLADSGVLLVGQFETREGERPYEPVVRELDVAFIGSTDLSVEFGVPGTPEHPAVLSHAAVIEAAAFREGTFMGAFVDSAEAARRKIVAGYRYLAVSSDISLISREAHRLVTTLRELREQTTAD